MGSLYKFQKLTTMGLKRKRELGHINDDNIAEGVYMGVYGAQKINSEMD